LKKRRYTFKHRRKRKIASLKQRLDAILQLADAVKYLHSQKICHRDLKPENIGFRNGVLKLYDFDVARILPESAVPDETFALTKKVGSYRYMSPECAKGEPYNLKSDVYSFSLLCHEAISLLKPYTDIRSEEHEDLVFHRGARPNIPVSWTEGIRSLLHSCWSENLSSRPNMEEVHRMLEQQVILIISEKRARHSVPWSFTARAFQSDKSNSSTLQ
jgi:serine/threonine protein kinase